MWNLRMKIRRISKMNLKKEFKKLMNESECILSKIESDNIGELGILPEDEKIFVKNAERMADILEQIDNGE